MIPAVASSRITAMTPAAIDKVGRLQAVTIDMPQSDIATQHIIHGGMYARTITIPAGVLLTGSLIKLATMLIFNGHAIVYTGDDQSITLVGYNVIAASAGRKQVFMAIQDTELTMIFPTDAKTVEEAEMQFTDDYELLLSRRQGNDSIIITGE